MPVIACGSGLVLSFCVGQMRGENESLRQWLASETQERFNRENYIRVLQMELQDETTRRRAGCLDEHDAIEQGRISREQADQDAYEERHRAWCVREDAGASP
jgi:hypothetical protein